MKISADPSTHRHREEQIVQHVEKLLADDRLRVDTLVGRRPVTAFVRDVAHNDGAIELKRKMTELNVPDRELQSRMPVGKTLEVTLTQTRWLFFTQNVGRIRVLCVSPVRELLLGEEPQPLPAGEVTRLVGALPRSSVPTTIVLVSTGGFSPDARELAERNPERTIILVEPNEAGGWSATGSAETRAVADLFDPEGDEQKRQRVLALIEENRVDLLTSGIATDKIASRAQVPLQLVESIVKEYARQTPGLNAKRLDGRVVLFREGTNASAADDSGGSMGLINKVRTLLGGKGDTGKKVAFLSERKAALSQQRDRAYEDMADLEQQESQLKSEFKEADSAITKRRITGQMLQLRKDLDRRQQLLTVLNQQINVVSTHLHNLELVQQGQTAKLPNNEEITEDAVKAEEMLAELEANTELAGSVGPSAATGMSDEEKALYEELERENAAAEAEAPEPLVKKAEPKKTVEKEPPQREPAARAPSVREPQPGLSTPPPIPSPTRRAEPEAG